MKFSDRAHRTRVARPDVRNTEVVKIVGKFHSLLGSSKWRHIHPFTDFGRKPFIPFF
jgi:hypothetical protein